jgi:arsenite methyltransferase
MSALERLGVSIETIRQLKQQYSEKQAQTKDTFAFKWSKRDTYESEALKKNTTEWLFERYCNNNLELLDKWLAGGGKLILDAGCGAAYSALLFFKDHLLKNDYLGVDISNAVEIAQQRFKEQGYPGDFLQTSLMDIPIPDESIDLIYSEGVLHHTDNTKNSIAYLATKLKKGGMFLFYVYAKKAVIREFTDDHVRQALSSMSDEEAWQALKPLSKLGIALGELGIDIEVPEDIPFLGIKRGKQDLQRFFYWNICKLFYRPEYHLDEMNHINFDWFRPLNCHRHTKEEIEEYCARAGLSIESIKVEEAGITTAALKK